MSWKNDQVSESETKRILKLAQECLKVPGDFVEFGCYKGDTSLLLAELLVEKSVDNLGKSRAKTPKRLWIYDSFEGLPEKTSADKSILGQNFCAGKLNVTKRKVKERFLRANLPVPIIKKGWFKELNENDLPPKIAFAFLDGDFYESIRDSLKLVEPKMSPDGMLIVHDYSNPALPGVQKAIEEWGVQKRKFKMILL